MEDNKDDLQDIYIGTPSKDELKRYFNRIGAPTADIKFDESVECLSSEDELSSSFDEFLKKTVADKKKLKANELKTPEDTTELGPKNLLMDCAIASSPTIAERKKLLKPFFKQRHIDGDSGLLGALNIDRKQQLVKKDTVDEGKRKESKYV